MSIKDERAKTAMHRFYIFSQATQKTVYPITICDAEAEPKSIAKFRNIVDAELFLNARRKEYIKKGS